MKRIVTALSALALFGVAATAFAGASNIRISQVYGGGGGSTGTYKNDYVEIFNPTNSNVDISGWSLQYGSATGTSGWGSGTINNFAFPAGTTIKPCSYILVQTSAAGTGGVDLPVTPDFVTTTLNMSQSAGKIALIKSSANPTTCSGSTSSATIADAVGYGSTANCFEGAAAGGTTSTSGNVRALGGMTDNDNNSTDFSVVSAPVPHNSAVGQRPTSCLTTATSKSTWGSVKSIYR